MTQCNIKYIVIYIYIFSSQTVHQLDSQQIYLPSSNQLVYSVISRTQCVTSGRINSNYYWVTLVCYQGVRSDMRCSVTRYLHSWLSVTRYLHSWLPEYLRSCSIIYTCSHDLNMIDLWQASHDGCQCFSRSFYWVLQHSSQRWFEWNRWCNKRHLHSGCWWAELRKS